MSTRLQQFLNTRVLMMKEKHMFFGMEGIIIVNWKHFIPPVHQVQLTNIACVLYTNNKNYRLYRQKQAKLVWNSKRSFPNFFMCSFHNFIYCILERQKVIKERIHTSTHITQKTIDMDACIWCSTRSLYEPSVEEKMEIK
jgi:hypothetical protein